MEDLDNMTGRPEVTFCLFEPYTTNIPYCHIVTDLIDGFDQRGFSTRLIAPKTRISPDGKMQPDHNGLERTELVFQPLTGLSGLDRYISYPLFVFFYLLVKGHGYVIVPSTPPVVMGFFVALAKSIRREKFCFLYHCQDIHPEALVYTKVLKNNFLISVLKKIDNFTVSKASAVVTLSGDMINTLRSRKGFKSRVQKISCINNFVPSAYIKKADISGSIGDIREGIPADETIFVFAGNIGVFQNLEKVLRSFLRAKVEKSRLVFIGEGRAKERLKKTLERYGNRVADRVSFVNKIDSNNIVVYIQKADYGVVSLAPSVLKVAFPSKVMTYLSIGLPIFLVADKETALGKSVCNRKLGVVSNSSSEESIVEKIKEACQKREFYSSRRSEISRYYQKEYGRECLINQFIDTVEQNRYGG